MPAAVGDAAPEATVMACDVPWSMFNQTAPPESVKVSREMIVWIGERDHLDDRGIGVGHRRYGRETGFEALEIGLKASDALSVSHRIIRSPRVVEVDGYREFVRGFLEHIYFQSIIQDIDAMILRGFKY